MSHLRATERKRRGGARCGWHETEPRTKRRGGSRSTSSSTRGARRRRVRHCGDADCPGCLHEQTRSGVVAIVAWERPWRPRVRPPLGHRARDHVRRRPLLRVASRRADRRRRSASPSRARSWRRRRWRLARLVPLVALLAPSLGRSTFCSTNGSPPAASRRPRRGRLAALLVAAHVAHGWALDRGAGARARRATTRAAPLRSLRRRLGPRRRPARRRRRRLKEGAARRPVDSERSSWVFPGRSARAFLRGCYRLEGASAEPALRASYVAAALATLVGARGRDRRAARRSSR